MLSYLMPSKLLKLTQSCRNSKRKNGPFSIGVALLAMTIVTNTAIAAQQADVKLNHSDQLDRLTELALFSIVNADWPEAESLAYTLVTDFPDFSLGHLLLADIKRVSSLQNSLLFDAPAFSADLLKLLLEARTRLHQHKTDAAASTIPAELIQVGNHIDHIVLADLETSMIYLYENGPLQPRLLKKHYISSGIGGFNKTTEGDLKSPLGIYNIEGFRSDASLPELYGAGALMLDYPNTLDKALGRTGYGIWLHGVPKTDRSRSPRSSEGCVTMANDHLIDLHRLIKPVNTHVILTDKIQWLPLSEQQLRKERLQELFKQYQSAWLGGNVADLNAIYSKSAIPAQVRHAYQKSAFQRVNLDAPSIKPEGLNLSALSAISASDISILENPEIGSHNTPAHLIMSFITKEAIPSRVTLYWAQSHDGYWEIFREKIE